MRRLAAAARRRVRKASAPTVTVVVPAETAGERLDTCLRSVLASRHPALEVLVVGAGAGGTVPARGVRLLPHASCDDAVAAAQGSFLVVVSTAETVPPDAWPAMVSALEETGSDLAVGSVRAPEPRPWAAELTGRPRLRQTVDTCPLALVDLAPTGKMFRLSAWRRSGARFGAHAGGEVAVLSAFLDARTFDVLPRVVSEVRATDSDAPVADQQRFRPDRVAARLDALLEAARGAPAGWPELVATYLLPPLYADAVGGGDAYLSALRPRVTALLDGLDGSAVPVGPRLGAWSALHGTLQDVALVQDLLADHPHGLPAADGSVLVPDGLSAPVPDGWRRLSDADRAVRSRVLPWLLADGEGRPVVRGASFLEYVEDVPLPVVALRSADGSWHELVVRRRPDPRTNEWAARAWEDRTDAAWEAAAGPGVAAHDEGPWTVEVRLAGRRLRQEVRRPPRQVEEATVLEDVSFADGVLHVAGRTRATSEVRGHVAGARGDGGDLRLRAEGDRVVGDVELRTAAFGERVRLPVGRYDLGLASTAWHPGLLVDPADLLDARQRVGLVQGDTGAGVLVQPPLGTAERSAHGQQDLRTRVFAAPAGMRDRTVLLETFRGRSVGDNPGAVARELAARELDLDLVWVVDDPAVEVPAGTRAVARRTEEWHALLGHARGYVANAGAPYWFGKPAGQFHLQTWHGTPLKRIGEDRGPGDFSTWRHRRRIAAQAAGWDAMISPSPYCTEIFRSAFRYRGRMLESGYPRNDVLVNDRGEVRRRVRERLGVEAHDRLVLYAPTWREYLGVRTSKPLYLDPERLTAAMPDTVLLVRGHYNSTGQQDLFTGHDRIHDVTRYPDIADLYLAADALVTDYSSVMFDFVLTDRPVVLLVPDLDRYRDVERGFYLDLETRAPGPLVDSTDAVVDVLRGVDAHGAERAAFRKEFCPWDDGRASARVVDDLLAHW